MKFKYSVQLQKPEKHYVSERQTPAYAIIETCIRSRARYLYFLFSQEFKPQHALRQKAAKQLRQTLRRCANFQKNIM